MAKSDHGSGAVQPSPRPGPRKANMSHDTMGGETFYPQGKRFDGPGLSVVSPSNLFNTLPFNDKEQRDGTDEALDCLHSQGKTGITGGGYGREKKGKK